jgi:hypothetical protein
MPHQSELADPDMPFVQRARQHTTAAAGKSGLICTLHLLEEGTGCRCVAVSKSNFSRQGQKLTRADARPDQSVGECDERGDRWMAYIGRIVMRPSDREHHGVNPACKVYHK